MQTLIGITFDKLRQLLQQNKFSVQPKHVPKVLFLTLLSIRNSRLRKKELRQFADALEKVAIEQDPVFILGHWRSGTTLLHKIMALDKQFNFPTVFQIYNPNSLLYMEPRLRAKLESIPEQKRPMDNMTIRFDDPGEEEFAVSVTSLKSPVLGWVFPKNNKYYDRYLTFNDVDAVEIEQWKASLLLFLKKLTLRNPKPLLLKSPQNTGRIKEILELFPRAKFIHLHRHPYAIFRSTLKLYQETVARFYLQEYDSSGLEEEIIKRYVQIYDAFFEERSLIPANQFYELGFEDFEQDRLKYLQEIYRHLDIPDFDVAKPYFIEHLERIKDYKKNVYREKESWQDKVADAWQQSFSEWNYEK